MKIKVIQNFVLLILATAIISCGRDSNNVPFVKKLRDPKSRLEIYSENDVLLKTIPYNKHKDQLPLSISASLYFADSLHLSQKMYYFLNFYRFAYIRYHDILYSDSGINLYSRAEDANFMYLVFDKKKISDSGYLSTIKLERFLENGGKEWALLDTNFYKEGFSFSFPMDFSINNLDSVGASKILPHKTIFGEQKNSGIKFSFEYGFEDNAIMISIYAHGNLYDKEGKNKYKFKLYTEGEFYNDIEKRIITADPNFRLKIYDK